MDTEDLKKIDKFIGDLKTDIEWLESDMKLLNLPDETIDKLDMSIKILKRKVLEIEHVESKKQLKKHININLVLGREKDE